MPALGRTQYDRLGAVVLAYMRPGLLGIGGVIQLQLLCEHLLEYKLHCRQMPLQPEQARETLVEARAPTLEREFGRRDESDDAHWQSSFAQAHSLERA